MVHPIKWLWWRRNRGRISRRIEEEAARGQGYCLAYQCGPKDEADCIRKIIRQRRHVDRLKQLYNGKSPWTTATMPGSKQRDLSFRLMRIGIG